MKFKYIFIFLPMHSMKPFLVFLLIVSLLAFAMSPKFINLPKPVILKPNTPLSKYDPDNSEREGHKVLCKIDNENPAVTGTLMTFSKLHVRILLDDPVLPSWEFLPDTYTMDTECIVL